MLEKANNRSSIKFPSEFIFCPPTPLFGIDHHNDKQSHGGDHRHHKVVNTKAAGHHNTNYIIGSLFRKLLVAAAFLGDGDIYYRIIFAKDAIVDIENAWG